MLRLHDGQATLWEQMLPDEIRLMGPELEAVDSLLDDPRFLAPFVERFFCAVGRPTIPGLLPAVDVLEAPPRPGV